MNYLLNSVKGQHSFSWKRLTPGRTIQNSLCDTFLPIASCLTTVKQNKECAFKGSHLLRNSLDNVKDFLLFISQLHGEPVAQLVLHNLLCLSFNPVSPSGNAFHESWQELACPWLYTFGFFHSPRKVHCLTAWSMLDKSALLISAV